MLDQGGLRSLRVKAMAETHLLRIDQDAFMQLRDAKDSARLHRDSKYLPHDVRPFTKTNEFIERELRHESPTAADFTSVSGETIADRARGHYPSFLAAGDETMDANRLRFVQALEEFTDRELASLASVMHVRQYVGGEYVFRKATEPTPAISFSQAISREAARSLAQDSK